MRVEFGFVLHVGGAGDVEAQVEELAVLGAGEFDLAEDGEGADAEADDRGVKEAIDGGEGEAADVGDGDAGELALVPIAKLDRFAAAVGEKLGVARFVDLAVAALQVAQLTMQIEQPDSLFVDRRFGDARFEQFQAPPIDATLRGVGAEGSEVQADRFAGPARRAIGAIEHEAAAAITVGQAAVDVPLRELGQRLAERQPGRFPFQVRTGSGLVVDDDLLGVQSRLPRSRG